MPKLKGMVYIKGHITIMNSVEFKRNTLFKFMGEIGKAIHHYMCVKEHTYLTQSHMVRGEYIEKGVDMDDVTISRYNEGDGVRFNIYTKKENLNKIINKINEELNSYKNNEMFSGIQLLFDYHQITFKESYLFTHNSIQSSYLFELMDNHMLAVEEINKFSEVIAVNDPVDTLRTYTDFIVISSDYEGSYQLIAEMVYRDRIDFMQSRDNLTEHSEQLISLLAQFVDRWVGTIYQVRESNKELINLFEVLIQDTLGDAYLIGEEQLFDYFNDIAQLALKGILSGELARTS